MAFKFFANRQPENNMKMNRFYNWGKIDSIIENEMKMETFQREGTEIDDIIFHYTNLYKQISL